MFPDTPLQCSCFFGHFIASDPHKVIQINMFDKQDLVKLATLRMPFGKYSGRLLIDLPEPYLLWFANKGFPEGQLGNLLQIALEIKINGLEYLITPLKGTPVQH